ncbi:MAG: hypothetical protein J6X28_02490 [Bacilli bacterium]|nr:hypothetical protein [Bacilli bacterium]
MVNKKKVEKEPEKNYVKNSIILIVLFGVCIFLTLYFCKWYEVYKEYEKETPVIRGSLSEINKEDLDHYVVDNSDVIIYMCTATDDDCRSFEKDFKKYIRRNEITDEVVYLNLTGIDIKEFVKEFNDTYSYKVKLNGRYPAFVAFQDGKVISILQGSRNKTITISKVQSFLEIHLQEEEEEDIMEEEEVEVATEEVPLS